MTKFLNSKTFLFAGVMAILFVTDAAMAAGTSELSSLLGGQGKTIIDWGFYLFAALKWYEYFANFDSKSAFANLLTPALITILAFQWTNVLSLFGLL